MLCAQAYIHYVWVYFKWIATCYKTWSIFLQCAMPSFAIIYAPLCIHGLLHLRAILLSMSASFYRLNPNNGYLKGHQFLLSQKFQNECVCKCPTLICASTSWNMYSGKNFCVTRNTHTWLSKYCQMALQNGGCCTLPASNARNFLSTHRLGNDWNYPTDWFCTILVNMKSYLIVVITSNYFIKQLFMYLSDTWNLSLWIAF